MPPIYYIKQGSLSFAEKMVFEDIEIYLHRGDKICLIGKNGSGKSSLMKVISEDYEIDVGETYKDPSIKIGYLKQDIIHVKDSIIYEYVLENMNLNDEKYLADMILENLFLDGNEKISNLSGGQKRRVELAKSLISKPDILLLDEPTNHLDISSIEWLEDYVKSYEGCVICISHDRAFLSNVTNKIWWIDRGFLRKSENGFKYFEEWQEQIIQEEENNLRKLERKMEEEDSWLHGGVTGRRKRNQKRLADLISLRSELHKQKENLSSAKRKVEIELSDAKKSNFIIEAEDISFRYGDKEIIKNFSIKIKKGEKIGLIGPNGSGKSTLIKMIVGEINPFSGRIRRGNKLEISYTSQNRDIDENLSLWETICPNGGDTVFLQNRQMHVAAYLKKFMFDPKIIRSKISILSGGEKNRLLLAKTLINPGNFLVLDEPTNDLDMDSLDLLLEILSEYTGTVIIVSHDRDFLEKLVTRTLILSPDHTIIDMIGGYSDYLSFYKNKETKISDNKQKKENKNNIQDKDEENKLVKKLSYKYIRLLEVLPIEIDDLEKKISDLEEKLSDASLFQKDPVLFEKLSKDLENSKNLIDIKMEEWMKIEEMKNSLTKA